MYSLREDFLANPANKLNTASPTVPGSPRSAKVFFKRYNADKIFHATNIQKCIG